MPRTPQVIAQRTARLDGRVILNLLFAGLLLCASMLAAAAHAKAPPQRFADLTERLRPAVATRPAGPTGSSRIAVRGFLQRFLRPQSTGRRQSRSAARPFPGLGLHHRSRRRGGDQ